MKPGRLQIAKPIQVTGIVHVPVYIQVRKADGAQAGTVEFSDRQPCGGFQLCAKYCAGNIDPTFAWQHHGAAVHIHNDPKADDLEQGVTFCVKAFGGSGIGHSGGGHGPGFDGDGLTGFGQSCNFHALADHGPKVVPLCHGIPVGAQQNAMFSGGILSEAQNAGGLASAEAIGMKGSDFIFCCVYRIHLVLPQFASFHTSCMVSSAPLRYRVRSTDSPASRLSAQRSSIDPSRIS